MSEQVADVVVLVNEGEKWIQSRLLGLKYYGAWGSGSGTLSKYDTALFHEESETRRYAHHVKIADDTIQETWALTASAAKTITEAGLFNGQLAGLCDYHATFTGIVLQCGDSIGFTLTDEQT